MCDCRTCTALQERHAAANILKIALRCTLHLTEYADQIRYQRSICMMAVEAPVPMSDSRTMSELAREEEKRAGREMPRLPFAAAGSRYKSQDVR